MKNQSVQGSRQNSNASWGPSNQDSQSTDRTIYNTSLSDVAKEIRKIFTSDPTLQEQLKSMSPKDRASLAKFLEGELGTLGVTVEEPEGGIITPDFLGKLFQGFIESWENASAIQNASGQAIAMVNRVSAAEGKSLLDQLTSYQNMVSQDDFVNKHKDELPTVTTEMGAIAGRQSQVAGSFSGIAGQQSGVVSSAASMGQAAVQMASGWVSSLTQMYSQLSRTGSSG